MSKKVMRSGIIVLAALFVIAGAILLIEGNQTRTNLIETLASENITGADPQILLTYEGARAPEGVTVPEAKIDTGVEAYYQAQVIQTHTMNITDGKTYAEMDRDDPGRGTYITSLTLQNSLNMAYMGIEITRLIIGLGVAFLGLGAGMAVFGLPITNKLYAS
jgi:hypothetical protein